mgnify:CR=1 FL=1
MKQYKIICDCLSYYDQKKLENILNENSKNGFTYKNVIKTDGHYFFFIFEKEIKEEG